MHSPGVRITLSGRFSEAAGFLLTNSFTG